MGIALKPDEDLGPVDFTSSATRGALKAVLNETAGPYAVRGFTYVYGKRTQDASSEGPGKAPEEADFYEALFERLVELQSPDQGEMQALADERGRNIAEVLTSKGVAAHRIAIGAIRSVERSTGDDVVVRLALEAMSGGS